MRHSLCLEILSRELGRFEGVVALGVGSQTPPNCSGPEVRLGEARDPSECDSQGDLREARFWPTVAVGTTIADRPRTDPYKRVYAYGSYRG